MRALACLICCSALWPLAAQMDEKPPILRRDPSPNNPFPSGRNKGKESDKEAKKEPLVTGTGTVRRIDENLIEVVADDSRVLTCSITSRTVLRGPEGKITAEELTGGARVKVEATADSEGRLTATTITLQRVANNEGAEKTATIQSPAPDDEDRPHLRRGIPAKRKSTPEEDAEPAPKATAPLLAASGDKFLQLARDSNGEFIEHLPNFVCQQQTTRYERESKLTGWQAKDVITATLEYVDGKEEYKSVKAGGKSYQGIMDMKGQSSEGEFGSALSSLMARASEDTFEYAREGTISGHSAKVYSIQIKRANSDWHIFVGGQSIVPAYEGRVWFDRESGRVLRIERQATEIPEAFPMDVMEQTVDYDFVMIAGRKLLLPTESENLSCQRGSTYCAKNVINFRNYRQFRGEAAIDFEKDN